VLEQSCRLAHLLVCLVSELWKMADWIWVPFGVVSGLCGGMGALDGVEIVKGKGAVLGRPKCGASHCKQWDFAA